MGQLEIGELKQKHLDVIRLAAEGKTVIETGLELNYAPHTVRWFRNQIIHYLEANNMVHAVHIAHERGIL